MSDGARVRVVCDDPDTRTASGQPWHGARDPSALGDYLRTATATGAPLWEEIPHVPWKAARAIAARGGDTAVGVPTDGGGRIMWAPSMWDHSYRTAPATLYAVRDGARLPPRELGRLMWEAQRGIDRDTGAPVDVDALTACLVFAWRCPCARPPLVLPHDDVAVTLDAYAARGWVSLAELAPNTPGRA